MVIYAEATRSKHQVLILSAPPCYAVPHTLRVRRVCAKMNVERVGVKNAAAAA